MPSERVQQRIDRILDQADEAVEAEDWLRVAELARDVLTLDAGNADATPFLAMAERRLETSVPDANAPSPAPERTSQRPLPDSFVDGRYEVTDFLGEGGRKQVYLAHDTRLDRDVAFAVIKTEGLDATGRQRIQREAKAMGRLSGHPHIVTIHDVGEENGQPYIVSEYMAGGDVEALIADAENHQLSLERAVAIANQVAQALVHAHADGVVHRDIKPGNIWLAEDGTAKLGDFGLAFAASETRMTTEGTMLGTVAYMPPEQALGNVATRQSDLYSLGCALYEMVAGRPPFVGDDAVGVISQHLNTAPVAPSWNRQDCPPGLEHLILGLLEKTATERPESAAEVGTMLAAIDLSARVVSAEHGNPLDRLASGVFVGREEELQRLRRAFDHALGGHGELVMLVGQPGIGKTRTTYELETYARMRGALVAWGRNHENSGAPPYTPWVQVGNAVGQAVGVGTDPTALQGLGTDFSHLVRLFPVLRQMIPNFVEPDVVSDPDAAQYQLFEAYTQFIAGASQTTPLMLVLDDLHWTDKPSLLLLQHLARQLAGMRVLVVGTFRDTDLVRTHPLSEALATLNREGGFERMALRGLTPDECAAYIRGAANVEPSPPVLAKIVEETEGNPFFLSEVVNLMTEEGTIEATSLSEIAIPDGVREALGRRLDRLSEEANALLQIAAVVGREFRYGTLALISEHDDDTLLALVEAATEARVIEELDQPGRYRFTHALMQETLLDELSSARRVRLHGRIGDALEAILGTRVEPFAAELSRHFLEATVLQPSYADKAIHFTVLAGQQAEAVLAWQEAVSHYEACLRVLEEQGSTSADRAELTAALGRSLSKSGETERARAAWHRAFEQYEQRSDGVGLARAVNEAWDIPGGGLEFSVPVIEKALTALGDREPYLRARLLTARSYWMYVDEEAERAAAAAQRLAERNGYDDIRARLLYRVARGQQATVRLPETRATIDRALALDPEPKWGANYLIVSSEAYLEEGLLSSAAAAAEKCLNVVRPRHEVARELIGLGYLAAIMVLRADFDALAALREDLPGVRGEAQMGEIHVQLQCAAAADMKGHSDEAIGMLPDAAHAEEVDSRLGSLVWAAMARIHYHVGDTGRAREAMERWSRSTSVSGTGHVFPLAWRRWGLAQLDDCLAELGELETIEPILEEARGWSAARVGFNSAIGMDHVLGNLALRLDRPDDAAEHFRIGREWAEREGCPVEIGRCLMGLAAVAARRSDKHAEALRLLDQAIELFRGHGITLYLEQALTHKLELGGIASSTAGKSSIEVVAAAIDVQRPNLLPQAAPDGTVTLLFSDIENSTARTAALGDARWMDLLREHNTIVRDQLAAHGGYEVKSMGDGFMLAFGSALDGLRCAIGMQRAFAARNAQADETLRVRIGLHTGEAIKEADDFFGNHVNLAARIGGAAQGDEILVSGLLKALTESAGEFDFDAGREVALKGISNPQRVHAVHWR